jgi:hypothetical protein
VRHAVPWKRRNFSRICLGFGAALGWAGLFARQTNVARRTA